MSIEIIDKLKPKNGQSFKLMDAEDVAYDETISVKEAIRTLGNANIFYLQDKTQILNLTNAQQGSLIYVAQHDDVQETLFIIDEVTMNEDGTTSIADYHELKLGGGGGNSIPSLTYVKEMPENEKVYVTTETDLILRFNFTSPTYGTGNYKIYRNGSLIQSLTSDKGNVIVNLGKLPTNGSYEFTVTATDFLSIPAPETLTFTVVCGGLELTSSFDQTLATSIFETDTTINVPYTISCSDTTAQVKLIGKIINESNKTIKEEIINISESQASGYWNVGVIDVRGKYTLTLQGYTGETLDDNGNGIFKSSELSYTFNVLSTGEIAIISELDTSNLNTETYLTIPFRITTKVANYVLMRGKLYKKNPDTGEFELLKETPTSGISATVNVTGYWSVGLVEDGTYRYELIGSTADGGIVSLQNAIGEFDVVEATYTKVQPVTSNLIAWFDANEKRNSDEDRNIWYNNTKLGDTYRIYLHDLNYITNGWKHVDETLTDEQSGEYMLKFTGDSYGELMRVLNNGSVERYSPFSIFTNSGVNGFSLECTFRTRNVGEILSKVITCQNGSKTDTVGLSIGYDKAYLSSDIQTMNLDFAEDEWIHMVFVIDKNIRTLATVGQDNIENLNPVATMRIYINGCLCATNVLTSDNFVDSAKQSFPLMLNSCLVDGTPTCFGECEIKLLRIYNNYLTSSDVLTNYISSFYDLNEQQKIKDKNDPSKAVIPQIRFKKKAGTSNTFSFMNSITDKPTSKKYCVNCVMEYDDGEGNVIVYDNVDVYLQGTSSLQYPIKNYKIKCYQDDAHEVKNKIVLPEKDGIWKPEYCYTLKADFMEQSHINNTPTAVFYQTVIDALGGESPAKRDGYRDSIDGVPMIVYYTDDFEQDGLTLVGSYMFNLDKESDNLGFECNLYDEEGNIVGNGENTCVSYEGAANSSDTAGCFYKLSDSIASIYQSYVEECLTEYNQTNNTNLTKEEFQIKINNGEVEVQTFEEFQQNYDEIDYVMEDWEARYSFNEDDDEVTYRPMVNLINWINDSLADGTFKRDFEQHFDLTYCLAYYLQMIVFLQVDNCGKNMMMDTWDSVKFYPRPYDMDTQLGLSNTGTESIGTDAEIFPDISPTSVTGTYAGYSNNDKVTQNRYLSYNTKTSKLWNNFAKEFSNEIKSAYQQLRSKGIYTVENILNNAKAMTTDVIGEIYYNKDAAAKYLSQVDANSSEYLKALHGNRIQKVTKVIRERLLFCDTLFEYMESDVQTDTLNSVITLRSDAFYGNNASETESSTLKCSLGISVYSPMYITVNVGSGLDAIITAFVSPDSTYIDPDTGNTMEGTLFTFPIKATDKEMIITGGGNIKSLNRLEELNIRDLTIAKAEKILKLNLSNSTRMTTLTLGNNKLLRELDCSLSYLLGTGTGGQTLNLEKCLNLRTLKVGYTKLTALNLPTNGNLTTINIDASTIKAIYVDGMEFLTDISIDECNEIETYHVNNCPRLTEINVQGSTIKSFSATNCEQLTTINVSQCKQMTDFDVTNSDNITTLNMKGNTGSLMNDLKLYTLYNLQSLDVSNSMTVKQIRFPKYKSKEEADKANNGQEAILWDNLKSLTLSNSAIKYIQYGSEELAEGLKSCNMSQLSNLTSITFSGCTSVEKITNFNYSNANLSNLFYNCTSLISVQGELTATSSIDGIFSQCFVLSDLDSLVMNFTGVTNANRALSRCFKLKTNHLKRILDACGSSLQTIDSIVNMWVGTPIMGSASDDTRTISANLFENTPNLINLSSAFYNTKYTKIDGNALEPLTKIENLYAAFSCMNELATVEPNLLKNKPTLKRVDCIFAHDHNLKYYIDVDQLIFEGSPNITTTKEMFSRNNALLSDDIEGMLDELLNLTTCEYMFYDCRGLTCPIPNGFLAYNTKLQKIDGMFALCKNIPQICDRLFHRTLASTQTFPNLTQARGVFSGCEKMQGIISSNFFNGANELTQLGDGYNTTEYNSGSYYGDMYGFFANTAITGYHESFLNPLPKLLNCRGMFAKTSDTHVNASVLRNCYYYDGSEEKEYMNTVSENLFKMNTVLQNSAEFFKNNTNLIGHIPPKLFQPCKSTLRYASAMFENNRGLSGTNLDNTDETISSFTGISDWFNGCVNLLNCASFLRGCTSFNGTVHPDLFKQCQSLQQVNNFFYDCQLIDGNIPIELFNDCRETLTNTSYLFYNCVALEGEFPSGSYSIEQGVNGYEVCSSSEDGALLVVNVITDPLTEISYATVVSLAPNLASLIVPDNGYYVKPTIGDITTVIQYGLLGNCTKLQTTSCMFYNCLNLGREGCIPSDIFYTNNLTTRYTNLKDVSYMFYRNAIDTAYTDEETNIKYLCNPNLFIKCPNIENMTGMFQFLTHMEACQLPTNLFARQTALKKCDDLFYGIRNLTGSITQTFLMNSLGSLISVYRMFAFTNITSVTSNFLHGEGKNAKLQYVGGLFYNCTNITGACPPFYDGSIFTNLITDSKGYYGCLYGCTGLSNYSTAQAISNNYVANQGWTSF